VLAGDEPVRLHRARMQRLDAEEAAVRGQPQDIDHGVPQEQLRDEETDIADAAEAVSVHAGLRVSLLCTCAVLPPLRRIVMSCRRVMCAAF
jgi:hypothetical protein